MVQSSNLETSTEFFGSLASLSCKLDRQQFLNGFVHLQSVRQTIEIGFTRPLEKNLPCVTRTLGREKRPFAIF
ncbi:MAG: hypothetical protein WBF52_05710 [Geitlerinemataceae cyanobacterium]